MIFRLQRPDNSAKLSLAYPSWDCGSEIDSSAPKGFAWLYKFLALMKSAKRMLICYGFFSLSKMFFKVWEMFKHVADARELLGAPQTSNLCNYSDAPGMLQKGHACASIANIAAGLESLSLLSVCFACPRPQNPLVSQTSGKTALTASLPPTPPPRCSVPLPALCRTQQPLSPPGGTPKH